MQILVITTSSTWSIVSINNEELNNWKLRTAVASALDKGPAVNDTTLYSAKDAE